MTAEDLSGQQERWVLNLQDFCYRIEHGQGWRT
jgi:hypothetical protein